MMTSIAPFLVAASAAIVLVLGSIHLLYTFRGDNPSTTMREANARPAAVDWLRNHSRPERATNDVHLPQSFHNMGLRWRFESAGGIVWK